MAKAWRTGVSMSHHGRITRLHIRTRDAKIARSSKAVRRVILSLVMALEITTMPVKMMRMTLTIATETPRSSGEATSKGGDVGLMSDMLSAAAKVPRALRQVCRQDTYKECRYS